METVNFNDDVNFMKMREDNCTPNGFVYAKNDDTLVKIALVHLATNFAKNAK